MFGRNKGYWEKKERTMLLFTDITIHVRWVGFCWGTFLVGFKLLLRSALKRVEGSSRKTRQSEVSKVHSFWHLCMLRTTTTQQPNQPRGTFFLFLKTYNVSLDRFSLGPEVPMSTSRHFRFPLHSQILILFS